MKLEYKIGNKFAIVNKRFSFITTLSIISSFGIAIGVASLIIMISVFNGFGKVITDLMVGFDPHLRIENLCTNNLQHVNKILEDLNNEKVIKGISKTITAKTLIITNENYSISYLKGFEVNGYKKVSGLENSIIEGKSSLENNEVLISIGLANKLNLKIGDKINLYSTNDINNYLGLTLGDNNNYGIVIGIYRSGIKQYDVNNLYTNIKFAEKLLGNSAVVGYDIKLDDFEKSEKIKNELLSKFGNEISILTWIDLHKDLYSVMKIERWSAVIILTLIILVAICNLVGTLNLTVISKTKDIGLLRAIGFRKTRIKKIFQYQGLIIGLFGTTLGLIIGLAICFLQKTEEFYKLDPTVYIISAIPVEVKFIDIVIICFISFGLTMVATLIPSKIASEINPTEALRYE